MWEWLSRKIKEITYQCFKINHNLVKIDEDDIIQDVMRKLCNKPETAKEIYENQNIKILFTIVRREIYEAESKVFFANKMELSRFQRILAVCDKYGILPVPENAYKVSALIEKGKNPYEFSINSVANLLRYAQYNPKVLDYRSNKKAEDKGLD